MLTATSVEPGTRESLSRLGSGRLLEEVGKNCFLVSVTVRKWDGKYMIQGARIAIGSHSSIDESITSAPRWKLLPDEWHKRIQPFVSRARSVVSRVGVPLKDGVHIVPHARAQEMVEALKEIRENYLHMAEELTEAWPDITDRLRAKVVQEAGAAAWADLVEMLPPTEKLAKLFDIEVSLWPVGGQATGTGVPAALLKELETLPEIANDLHDLARVYEGETTEDGPRIARMRTAADAIDRVIQASRRKIRKVTQDNLEAWMQEASEVTNRLVAQAVESMLTAPIQEFSEAVKNLEELRAREGTCRAGTIEMIRRAHQKLMGFQFMVPQDLIERLNQVEGGLGSVTVRDVNTGSSVASNLTAVLRSISDELSSEQTMSRGLNQFSRHLDL